MNTDAIDRARKLPPPTVREICAELNKPTGTITYCTEQTQQGVKRRDPPELWIEALHTWLLCDGSRAQTAIIGTVKYKGLNRTRIAQAVKRWSKRP